MAWQEKLDKYWEGKSTLTEEAELKSHAAENSLDDAEYFSMLDEFQSINAPENLDPSTGSKNSGFSFLKVVLVGLCSMLLLMATFSFIKHRNAQNIAEQQHFAYAEFESPEEAFEFVKSTLGVVSGKLDKGVEYTSNIKKINNSISKIKK